MLIMSNSPQAFIVIQNLFSSPSLPFHFFSFFLSLSLCENLGSSSVMSVRMVSICYYIGGL